MVMYVGIYLHFLQYPLLKRKKNPHPFNFTRNFIQITGKKLKNTKAGQLTENQLNTLIRERACPDTSSPLKSTGVTPHADDIGVKLNNYSLQAPLHF